MLSGEMRPVPRSGYARSAKSAPPCDALLLAERLRWFGLSLRASEGLSRLGASWKIGVPGWWWPASRPEIFGTTVFAVHLHTGSVSLVRTSLDRTDVEHRTKLTPSGNHRGAQTALRSYAAIGSQMSLSSSATRVWPACCPIAEDRVRSRKLRAPSHRPARESTGLRARRLQDEVGDRCGGRSTTRAESHASVRAMPAFIRLRVYAHPLTRSSSIDGCGRRAAVEATEIAGVPAIDPVDVHPYRVFRAGCSQCLLSCPSSCPCSSPLLTWPRPSRISLPLKLATRSGCLDGSARSPRAGIGPR
jgi:hypothetical protein